MAIQRTTPGSYEAPVQGVVDYGAFSRGFNSAFIVPQPEEEKDPLAYDDPSGAYVTTEDMENDSGGLFFGENAAEGFNNSEIKLLETTKPKYEDAAKNQDQRTLNSLTNQFDTHAVHVNNFQEGSSAIVRRDEFNDERFTSKIPFAKTGDGKKFISALDFFGSEVQKNGKFSYNVYKKGARTITEAVVEFKGETYIRDITGFNKNNALNFVHDKLDLNTKLGDYSKTIKGKPVNINSADYETLTEQSTVKGTSVSTTTVTTTNTLRPQIVNRLEKQALGFADIFDKTATNQEKTSLYADILYGENNKKNFDEGKSGGYIEGYEGGVFVFEGKEYTFEDFKSGEAPDAAKKALIKDYLVNIHKTNASTAYRDPKFNNHPVLASELVDTKEVTTPIDPEETSIEKARENLLNRTQSLINRVNKDTYSETEIKNAIANNQINVAGVGAYTIPAESVGISFKEGKKFPIITIKPFEAKAADGTIVPVELDTYDLSKASGIEKYMKAIYGTGSDTGRVYNNLYLPVARQVLKPFDLNAN